MSIHNNEDRSKLKVPELKALCRERDVGGYTRMKKSELIDCLNNSDVIRQGRAIQPVPEASKRTIGVQTERRRTDNWVNRRREKKIEKQERKRLREVRRNKEEEKKKEDRRRKNREKRKRKKERKRRKEENKDQEETWELRETNNAIRGFAKQYTIDGRGGIDPESFLNKVQPQVIDLLSKNRQTKVNLILTCIMERIDIKTGEVITANPSFRSNTEIILEATDLNEIYGNAVDKIKETIANFQMQGSNWQFRRVDKLDINMVIYRPLRGTSYINLPKNLKNKKAIINPKNEEDEECFKWSITIAQNYQDGKKNPQRINPELRKQAEELNWRDISFPTSFKDIKTFEENNPGIKINVFGYEKGIGIYPLRHSKDENAIDLLLISDDENDENDENDKKWHYCWIKNFNRLMCRHPAKSYISMYYCKRCLNGWTSEEALNRHKIDCNKGIVVRKGLPKPGSDESILSFKDHHKSMRVPFVFYADFESIIEPIDTCQPNPNKSYTNKYQKHTPISFTLFAKCYNDSILPPHIPRMVTYTAKSKDDDVGQIFVDKIEEMTKQIYKVFNERQERFKNVADMIYTNEDKKNFKAATVCHICKKDLATDKVRDHCHITGKFRGAAHTKCNLNYRVPNFIPVLFHNLSGYDSHLFIKKLNTNNGNNITCIPRTEENYVSFSKMVVVDSYVDEMTGKVNPVLKELRFLDTFNFMASSLDALSKNLSTDQCKNLNAMYSGKKFDLLRRKGVFPYEYMDSVDRLNEDRLPPKSAFYSRLNESNISDEDYIHAQEVWKEFGCESLRDYLKLYNESDVLILADVFESFRDMSMKNYKLDPAWCYTAPGLAWAAALKYTKVKLELLSNVDMLLMYQKGIRGGVSMISKRYAKANNKYMGEAYDPSKPSKFITYLDANNLYGWAMSKKLPTDGFEWMTEDELENWRNIPCIVEVDLEYPVDIHDLHNDYPLAPENIIPPDSNVKKLIPNLNNKKRYVVHHEALKLYESFGLKMTKVHSGIKCKESAWLKPYIDLNTKLRTQATNGFEKDFFKLMNNSVFGKTIENIENRVDMKLVCDQEKAIKLAAKPYYDRTTIFDENLVAIHMKRTKVFYNKPIYLGMSILDISKTLMYDFHYDYIKPKYGKKATLLFTDTDSLMYEIQTEDFYADIAPDVDRWFDTSEYPEGLPLKAGVNKKVIGMFKDEACGKQIEEFVGLRAKLYSYKIAGKEEKKCKGIKKVVVKNRITHDDYIKCLKTKAEQLRKMIILRSDMHDVYTEEVNKIALSADDDKRIILEDGISTLSYGHYKNS